MNGLEILLSRRWILKSRDKDLYYQLRDQLGSVKKFLTEKLGYQVVVNPYLIKVEKLPAQAKPWMGIQEFNDRIQYVFLCLILSFLEVRDTIEESPGQVWLRRALEGDGTGAGLLLKQYREDKAQLHGALEMVIKASGQLPVFRQTFEALPVFAARMTGNPHAFDSDQVSGRLLEAFLADHYGCSREPEYSEAEWKSRILYHAGILRDELSNHTMIYGIRGECRDGTPHEGICGFCRMREPMVCTLRTLGGLKTARGNETVYVVENPAVFSELMRRNPVRCGMQAILTRKGF